VDVGDDAVGGAGSEVVHARAYLFVGESWWETGGFAENGKGGARFKFEAELPEPSCQWPERFD
jgi:hypothetical protein